MASRIVFADAGGARVTFREMAQQLANLGYLVLLPNLYDRLGATEPFDGRTGSTTQPNALD